MRIGVRRALLTLAFCLALASAPGPAGAVDEIIIGTGERDSVHHHVGRAICHIVNRHAQDVRCEARPTTGSLSNLSNVRNGAIEVGIALSDWHFHTVNGTGPAKFMDGNFENLRSLFSLHAEPFTVVARRDSGIAGLDDLKGKRVNIGNPGSEQRAAMDALMAAQGWTDDDFLLTAELSAAQQSLAFCHDRVQAMVYRAVHPNAAIQQAGAICDAVLVTLAGQGVRKLVADNPHYSLLTIPGGLYENSPKPVQTFGVLATFVSSSDVSEEVIFRVVQAVFKNLDALKKTHPSLRSVEAPRMMSEGLAAPLHPGAERYFEEAGQM